MSTPRILASHPAPLGWVCCYFLETIETPILIGLPVVLWTLVELPIMENEKEVGTQQVWRPYVANRHGQIDDYQATQLTFLVMVPPSEDWQRVGAAAFEHWLQGRAALETAKRQAEADGAASPSVPN